MTLTVMQAGETKNFVRYETVGVEDAFKADLFVVKLWIPKSQLKTVDENGEVVNGSYPSHIDLVIKE